MKNHPRIPFVFLLILQLLTALIAGPAMAAINTLPDLKELDTYKAHLYKVRAEVGKRRTKSGAIRRYTVYIPEKDASLPGGPYPAVVLIHGFLMTGIQHRNNAEYMAQHGIIAYTPNIAKLLLGDDKRMHNVDDLVDDVAWLTGKSGPQPDYLKGLVDPNRIGMAGNSSGGAVILEMALVAQKEKIPIHTMVSLDGVPWDRTADRIADIQPIKFLCLRAEPCLCNYHARMLHFLEKLKFSFDDVKVNGAHHCDVENPTTVGCRSICGVSDGSHRMMFQKLLYYYMRDTLDAPRFGDNKGFFEIVQEMQNEDKVIAKFDALHSASTLSSGSMMENVR
jgi:pimeloyl-ACP methyl ester carboxylesterase